MSFFPRSFVSPHDATPSSFHPLFRLLDDFDNYSRTNPNESSHNHHRSQTIKSFTPKFDVKEVGDKYELHGDLPGIAQKDVEIEFTDETTLTIKGRTERSYTSGTPPAGAIEGSNQTKALGDGSSSHKDHQPRVEDEDAANNEGKEVEVANNNNNNEVGQASKEPAAKYWVSERSVGEFSRSFTFPVRVDQDAVQASMKDGVLSVVVPKAKKTEARKITIN